MASLRDQFSHRWKSYGDLRRFGSTYQLSTSETPDFSNSRHQLPSSWSQNSCQQLPRCPSQQHIANHSRQQLRRLNYQYQLPDLKNQDSQTQLTSLRKQDLQVQPSNGDECNIWDFGTRLSLASESSQLTASSCSCSEAGDSCCSCSEAGDSSCSSETARLEDGSESRASNSSSLLPYLKLIEIPPEKGLQRCSSWLRLAVRKCRKNILHRPTHQCTIPDPLRHQLRRIYVY